MTSKLVKWAMLMVGLILVAATYLAYSNGLLKTYQKTVTNDQSLILQNEDVLLITDTHYIQRNNIILKDNARLIITDSLFEHRQDFSAQYTLEAEDTAQVIIQDSEIRSSAWLNWNFRDQASLKFDHVRQFFSDVWHSFSGQARAVVTNSKFNGTLGGEAAFEIENSPSTFLELVLPVGAVVDEEFPQTISEYVFPNANEQEIGLQLQIKNSTASSWGITVNPRSKVTIRKTQSLIVTLVVGPPWNGVTASLDNLRPTFYKDQTWTIEDMSLRLVNVTTGKWSPIVGGNNTLILKNSDLSDNAFSSGNAKLMIEDSTTSFLRAKESVEMIVNNSTIEGDVVATDNGKITLINTVVKGKMIEEGHGQVIVE